MLPSGDGAGQHLCEGDLGYKQTKQKQTKIKSTAIPQSFQLIFTFTRGCVKKKYTTCFLIGFKGLICLKWLHMTGSGQNRVDIDHTL